MKPTHDFPVCYFRLREFTNLELNFQIQLAFISYTHAGEIPVGLEICFKALFFEDWQVRTLLQEGSELLELPEVAKNSGTSNWGKA